LFSHHHDDCCNPCPQPCPVKTCDSCCEKESCWSRLKGHFHKNECCDTCAKPTYCPTPTFHGGCNACCEERPSCLDKLRARLHHHDCCDTCCGSVAAPVMTPGKAPEPIKAPKDADGAKKLPEGGKEVRIIETNDVTPASASEPVQKETKSPFEISRRYESRV